MNKHPTTAFKKGHVIPQEIRAKISRTLTGRRGAKRTEETRKKMSEKAKGNQYALGCKRSSEWKKRCSEWMKGNLGWRSALGKRKNTKPELLIEEELKKRNINYKKQVPISGFCVDFYLEEYRIIIECDGDYWHNLPGAQENDARKTASWEFQGFKVFRFWEHEINKSAKECIDKIIPYS